MSAPIHASVRIDAITCDEAAQPRKAISIKIVREYSLAMSEGATFPRVSLFGKVGAALFLADGWHRLTAAKANGQEEIEAEIWPGGLEEAILYSVGVNDEHGFRRTSADKRRSVDTLLDSPKWVGWSDAAIAKACKVSAPTVARRRFERGDAPKVRTFMTKHGSISTMRVAQRTEKDAPGDDEQRPPELPEDALKGGVEAHTSGVEQSAIIGDLARALSERMAAHMPPAAADSDVETSRMLNEVDEAALARFLSARRRGLRLHEAAAAAGFDEDEATIHDIGEQNGAYAHIATPALDGGSERGAAARTPEDALRDVALSIRLIDVVGMIREMPPVVEFLSTWASFLGDGPDSSIVSSASAWLQELAACYQPVEEKRRAAIVNMVNGEDDVAF